MEEFRVTVMVPMSVSVSAKRRAGVTYEAIALAVDALAEAQDVEALRDHLDFSAMTPDSVLWETVLKVG